MDPILAFALVFLCFATHTAAALFYCCLVRSKKEPTRP